MNRFEWFLPTKPFRINQAWGILNPIYQQFAKPGRIFNKHNGIDDGVVTGTPILAPFDWNYKNHGNQPNGGGIFVSIISKNKYSFDDGKEAFVLIDFLHCKEIVVFNNNKLSGYVGETLAISNNTGFSTGSHTHLQFRRVDENFVVLDYNDANDSFDPMPYCNNVYAGVWVLFREILAQFNRIFGKVAQ